VLHDGESQTRAKQSWPASALPGPNAVPQNAARTPVGRRHQGTVVRARCERGGAGPFHLVSIMVLDLIRILVLCSPASAAGFAEPREAERRVTDR
jgi:hypothetical protein